MSSPEATLLMSTNGGYWGEHPCFPVRDWANEALDDSTRLGYWDWVQEQLDITEELDDG